MTSLATFRKRTIHFSMYAALICCFSLTLSAQLRPIFTPLSMMALSEAKFSLSEPKVSNNPFSEASPNAELAVKSPIAMPTFVDTTCVDLTLDSLKVLTINEKYIELEFCISNKGTAPAPIFGSKRGKEDNVAIHFYYSGSQRLTRGSIMADGIYLTEGLKETKGWLAPNAVYKQRFKLSLEKKNQYYGVIVLQLDAFDILRHECDETNNVKAIVPKWY